MLCTRLYALVVCVKSPHSFVPRSFGFLTQTTRAYNPVRRTFHAVNYIYLYLYLYIYIYRASQNFVHLLFMPVIQHNLTRLPTYSNKTHLYESSLIYMRMLIKGERGRPWKWQKKQLLSDKQGAARLKFVQQ